MFGGATISLILPKLIRSVTRDDIWAFWFGRQSLPAAIFNQRHKARTLRSTVNLPELGPLRRPIVAAVCN
jgi:hypothetical protein